eukprot:CAMPEP_0194031210 /NCGR_PEP_ID=MMETSP0009_2-20130614/4439_1 /TAXON_ID=210454 /ORGANISM="Grammatophora oceanica, Strain CCMP 410" /LENGTH=83 /DNA_ID=CAMNT_0038671299 /DNA_START=159 /DNA_END=410 /DNA_ORIENTATION=-
MAVSEPVTGKTPKRNRKQFYDKNDDELDTDHRFVKTRKAECPGFVVFTVTEDVANGGEESQASGDSRPNTEHQNHQQSIHQQQ